MSAAVTCRPSRTDPELEQLAEAHGVATSYDDWARRPVRVQAAAVVAALRALGVDASSPAAVTRALEQAQDGVWQALLPPTVVVRGERGSAHVHTDGDRQVAVEALLEDGTTRPLEVGPVLARRDARTRREVRLDGLPPGWHRLRAGAGGPQAEAVLLVAPAALPALEGRHWGWMVQLYALRSKDSWGLGDYGDLRAVVQASAAEGAGLLLANPLHAENPVPPVNPSPYSPSSRRFFAVVYLRVTDLPEYADAPAELRAQVDALRPPTDPERAERDPAWTAKLAALALLWPRHEPAPLAAYRSERGDALEDFALFCALAEEHGLPWQQWPPELRRPDAPGVPAARQRHAGRVAFWCWVQAAVDRQLAAVEAAAGGMAVGVVHDLAVGVDAGGADAWALQDVLALGTTVGAPPDSFNQQGQDWGLPPWRPDRLRETGYAPYRDMVRGLLRHAGGLRIDHVMGLFRLWWVPAGASPADGTYVRYDSEALLAVLTLEASRAGALVVGEDLGTVQDSVRRALAGAGVLGSAVLWFERELDGGAFLPPQAWREQALATVTTHDLPTAAGFLAGEHVRVRHELGQLGHPLEHEQERVREECAALLAMLAETGLLERYDGDAVLAMHAALVASPARLMLASLGDAVGDLRQPNLPGTVEQYPNWRLPVADGSGRALGLEELLAAPGVRRLAALLGEATGSAR